MPPDSPSSTDGAGREPVNPEDVCYRMGFKHGQEALRERTRVLEVGLEHLAREHSQHGNSIPITEIQTLLAAVAVEDDCCCGNGDDEEDRSAVLRCPVHGPTAAGTLAAEPPINQEENNERSTK